MILIFILIYIFVLKPVKNTDKAISALSSGDADLTHRLPVKGKDEIAKLCSGVNNFMNLLQDLIREIVENSRVIQDVVNDLGSSSQETASATAQIMANIDSVKNQSKNQFNAVKNTDEIIDAANGFMKDLKTNITYDEYKKHFEQSRSMVRRFQQVRINEPSEEECVHILLGIRSYYEDFHK